MEYKSVTIKPNAKKIFILNILKILIFSVIAIAIIIVIDVFTILDSLVEIFKIFNYGVEVNQIVFFLIILVVTISLGALIRNYIIVSNLSYEIYYDKIIYVNNAMFIFKNTVEINFRNVVRIYFSTKGLINQMFGTGSIIIDLTGLDKKSITLDFIGNIEQVTSYLQNVINKYRARMYSVEAERQKIGDIVEKGNI